ncbi:hypothetical protein J2S70_001488 [Trueperella bonasi]|uniref:Uncharacterized protein n=1 Tax=Trueperella bonasi TaxID=312286 RepID=A0ABT9NHM1_9ACTO|nr:hypothetical protein [Trueperella bonasi]MDP9806906.1 hypothetical protein [Trueperella bonasi]
MIKNLGEKYSPLYFLATLGFGGMAFFLMVFMHLTPHPGTMMPTFETIQDAFGSGDAFINAVIVIHFRLLLWNFREFNIFCGTEAYAKHRESNTEVPLMAIPLTLGASPSCVIDTRFWACRTWARLAAAFTQVCPGVGLSVVSMFFLRNGLIGNGLLAEDSFLFLAYLAGVAVIAAITLWAVIALYRNQLSKNGALAREKVEDAERVAVA